VLVQALRAYGLIVTRTFPHDVSAELQSNPFTEGVIGYILATGPPANRQYYSITHEDGVILEHDALKKLPTPLEKNEVARLLASEAAPCYAVISQSAGGWEDPRWFKYSNLGPAAASRLRPRPDSSARSARRRLHGHHFHAHSQPKAAARARQARDGACKGRCGGGRRLQA
jgi:hypothetical protein